MKSLLTVLFWVISGVASGRTGGTEASTARSMYLSPWWSALPLPLSLDSYWLPLESSSSLPGRYGISMTRKSPRTLYGEEL